MVVFDLTSKASFLNVSNWLDEIALNTSSNIVLVLVGNKCDNSDEFSEKQGNFEGRSTQLCGETQLELL